MVTSLVARLCLEVTPFSSSGSHLPFLLVYHVIMLMRNAAYCHNDEETSALASYLSEKVKSFKVVHDAGKWLAGCLGVTETALDVRARITVRDSLSLGAALRETRRVTCLDMLVSVWCGAVLFL